MTIVNGVKHCHMPSATGHCYPELENVGYRRILQHHLKHDIYCEAQGKGSTQEVTKWSFVDYRLLIVDIDFPDALH